MASNKPEPPTIGQQCAAILKVEKQSAVSAGRTMSWEEVASVIDGVVGRPRGRPKKATSPGPFGDKNAIPPTPEQVQAYSASIGYPMDGQGWCDSYAQKGWVVGKAKMRDWQAAVRNWKKSGWGQDSGIHKGPKSTPPGKDYTKL